MKRALLVLALTCSCSVGSGTGNGNGTPLPPGRTTQAALCHIQRTECAAQSYDPFRQVVDCTNGFVAAEFDATACYDPTVTSAFGACQAQYCQNYSGAGGPCNVTSATTVAFSSQACAHKGAAFDQGLDSDLVSCNASGRQCNPITSNGATICAPLAPTARPLRACFNPATESGFLKCLAGANGLRDPRALLTEVAPDHIECAPRSALFGDLTYDLPAGPMAHATFAGQTLDVGQRGGFVRIGSTCIGGDCGVSELVSLRILADDFTVSGVTIRNVEIRSNKRAPISGGSIAAGDLLLDLVGKVGSEQRTMLLVNEAPVAVGAGSTFSLQGQATIVGDAADGQAIPVNISIAPTGVAVPDQGCDTGTPVERLFGFEDASLWHSSQASLATTPNPRTQGCFSTSVSGSGYMTIAGNPFPAGAAGNPTVMKVDLFIPTAQPNPSWLGALQSYLECPSGNVFNAYIGQVELTGLPIGAFSSLSFTLPAGVRTALAGGFNDCSIKLALNVNQTGQLWFLDNLRFIP
jgi:hypothetical protein